MLSFAPGNPLHVVKLRKSLLNTFELFIHQFLNLEVCRQAPVQSKSLEADPWAQSTRDSLDDNPWSSFFALQIAQLEKDRDVVAQVEAITALGALPRPTFAAINALNTCLADPRVSAPPSPG